MIKDFKQLASDIEKSDKKSRIFFDFFIFWSIINVYYYLNNKIKLCESIL